MILVNDTHSILEHHASTGICELCLVCYFFLLRAFLKSMEFNIYRCFTNYHRDIAENAFQFHLKLKQMIAKFLYREHSRKICGFLVLQYVKGLPQTVLLIWGLHGRVWVFGDIRLPPFTKILWCIHVLWSRTSHFFYLDNIWSSYSITLNFNFFIDKNRLIKMLSFSLKEIIKYDLITI